MAEDIVEPVAEMVNQETIETEIIETAPVEEAPPPRKKRKYTRRPKKATPEIAEVTPEPTKQNIQDLDPQVVETVIDTLLQNREEVAAMLLGSDGRRLHVNEVEPNVDHAPAKKED